MHLNDSRLAFFLRIEGQAPTKVLHDPFLDCVPKSGATSGPKFGRGFDPGFVSIFSEVILKVFRTSIISGLGHGRGLKRNSKRSLQHVTKQTTWYVRSCSKARSCIIVKNIVLYLMCRFSSSTKRCAREHQMSPILVPLSGKFQQSVVTPSEQFLCLFHGHRRAKPAQIACFLAHRYIDIA